jgi:F0F1-type ATP synthase membrane subunit a
MGNDDRSDYFRGGREKGMGLIPGKVQNIAEIIISGLEEFMVGITGEEGRWLFPLAGTIFLYILVCNLMGLVPGFFSSYGQPEHNTVMCIGIGCIHSCYRCKIPWSQIHQTFSRPGLVDDTHYFSD